MKDSVKTILLFVKDMAKWAALAGLTGAVVGVIAAGFIWLLDFACGVTVGFEYSYLFLPAAMFLSAFIVKYLAPAAEGHGTEKAIEAIHHKGGRIALGVIPVKIVATVVTVSAGGSAGKEGPTTQLGAGAASFIARIFRSNEADRKILLICGMGAAFSAIFGTPIAAAVYAMEVLIVGRLNLKNIFPIIISAIVGLLVAEALGLSVDKMGEISLNFSGQSLVKLLLVSLGAGVFFGFVSMLTVTALHSMHKLSRSIRIYAPLKGLIGGAALVLLVLAFGKDYLGMGVDYFMGVASGATKARIYDFALKILFTAITLSFGGSGGILTPLMFIGITSGGAFAGLFGLDVSMFACLGMLAVLASSTNTPLACIIMAFEMFGNPWFALMAAVACTVSYLVTGHRSVYASQLMTESKIAGIEMETTTAENPKWTFIKKNNDWRR